MNKVFSFSLMALVFASCQSSGDRKMPEPTPSAPVTIAPSPLVLDSTNTGGLTNAAATTAAAPNTGNTAAVALNPEHGAPGHRCDIAVGAPLNSPSNSAPVVAPSNTTAPIMMKSEPAPPPPANNSVRLNPAHGAPGHDCAIPVGQPLKS